MALNPYTLYHLYEKGILDCVPGDLATGIPAVPAVMPTNPYLEMAQQGGLYQNYGMQNDTFIHSPYSAKTVTPIPSQVQTGAAARSGITDMFNGYGIGSGNSNSTADIFGFGSGVGTYSQTGGMNTFNGVGIGTNNTAGNTDIFGGFSDTQNRITDGYYKTKSFIDRTPKLILGIIAATIGILGIKHAFKGGKFWKKKTPDVSENKSFLSKINPKNWKIFGKKV